MMEKSKGSVIRFSSEKIELPCEWRDCAVVETVMLCLMRHISDEHLPSICEENLQCEWRDCDTYTDSLEELRRHVLYHAFHTKLKCYGKNFQQRNNLAKCSLGLQGRTIIPEIPEPFTCIWTDCQEVFENPEFFYLHVNLHAETSAKVKPICLWIGCNKVFHDPYKLKDHLRSHSQEKVIACPTCGGMFASRTKFLEHIQRQIPIVAGGSEVYTCEFCSRELATKKLLRDHMRLHVNHYKCPYCDMTCPTPSALEAHISYRHCDVKPYSCQYCDYKCKRHTDLGKHLETHSIIPLVCVHENCEFSSKSQSSYKKHLRTMHQAVESPKYACHLCSKVTTRGNYLTKHLIGKHNFCWPAGHCRFRYHQHSDGYYRLQTVRLESSELSESVVCETSELRNENVEFHIAQASVGELAGRTLSQSVDAIIAETLSDVQFLDIDSALIDDPLAMSVSEQ